jgi:hypothetical protein
MKRSIILATFLSVGLYADGLEEAFKNATYDGYIRAGFQHQDEGELAIGGKLHLQTAPVNGISFGTSFYTTQGVDEKYNDGVAFFSGQRDSYSILGEVYLQAEVKNTLVKVGRQELDTPYADTDDIGMIPNSFEALTFSNGSLADTTIFAGYLKKMSGVDADIAERFNSIGDVYTLGLTYEGFEGVTLSGWYYDVSDLVKMSYLEAGYEKKFANLNISFDFQYTSQEFDNGNAVDVYGASAAVQKSGITLSIAYDTSDSTNGQVAENFFGGGPFFINCEHVTMADLGADSDAYRVGVEIDGGSYDIEGFGMGLSYFEGEHLEEIDIVASYAVGEQLSLDLIYSDTTDNENASESFTNTRFFVNYRF